MAKKSTKKAATKKSTKAAPKASAKKAIKKAAPKKAAKPAAKKSFDAIAARDHVLKTLDFASGINKKLVADWPEGKLAHQDTPCDNHPLWTIGHLGVSNHWFASIFDGQPAVDANLEATYGGKSKPSANAADYPSLAETIKLYDQGMARLKKALTSPKDPLSKPKQMADWVSDTIHAAQLAVWHEGWHGGQLSTLRRSLGLPGVMS
ncbi:MAG: DinB family protein [Phycisphaerales bacterium]|nr:DinB family protein [Phycisphaerales bacterium]